MSRHLVATDCDRRQTAEPNTITGSVFGLLLNFQKLANNNGITWDVVKTNRYADSQTVSRLSLRAGALPALCWDLQFIRE